MECSDLALWAKNPIQNRLDDDASFGSVHYGLFSAAFQVSQFTFLRRFCKFLGEFLGEFHRIGGLLAGSEIPASELVPSAVAIRSNPDPLQGS